MAAKKLVSLVMCICMIIAMTGCRKTPADANSDSESKTESKLTQPENSSVETFTPDYMDLPSYLHELSEKTVSDVKKTASSNSKINQLELNEEMKDYILSVKLPESITSETLNIQYDAASPIPGEKRYIFSINNTPVGECLFNSLVLPKYVEKSSKDTATINVKLYITKMDLNCKVGNKSWEMPVYRIQVIHLTKQFYAVMYFRQDVFTYEQILEIANSMQFHLKTSVSRAGEVDYTGKDCKILILGNSFIASSQIGVCLQEIAGANRVSLMVDAISRGNAEVITYASDSEMLGKIKSGEYDVIFLCGFYQDMDAELVKIMNILPASTKLVIFPAHNESEHFPYYSRSLHPELGLADWKGFISQMINDGIKTERFCVMDYYRHSNSLGGYAGACLIYSYLYKKAADGKNVDNSVVYEQVESNDYDKKQIDIDLAKIREQANDFLYN